MMFIIGLLTESLTEPEFLPRAFRKPDVVAHVCPQSQCFDSIRRQQQENLWKLVAGWLDLFIGKQETSVSNMAEGKD